MIFTRTPVAGVLVFIASCLALAIYSTCSTIRNGVIYLSKKKILKAILMALTVLLTAAQSSDGKENPVKFFDNPDTHLE
jgi:choline-glycine betaine transporter